jgi:N-acetylglucosaminyl-diphospho-decaprenol L-rhamnosyltransferase
MRLGAVVLSHEPGQAIVETLAAISRSQLAIDDVLVVDNNSSRESLRPMLTAAPAVEIKRLPTNDGYGAAMNDGAGELIARGCDTLLFLTQETILQPEAAGCLYQQLNSQPDTGIVGPILCRRSNPAEVWSAGGRFGGLRRTARHLESGQSLASVDRVTRQVRWLDGACLMMPAAAFRAVDGFRCDLFLYWEDVDICLRLHRIGRAVTCVGAAIAFQEPSRTPPYLAARNRVLVRGTRGSFGVLLDLVIYAIADPLRGRGLRRVVLEGRGLRDGVRHRLDRVVALERPA